MNGFAHLVLLFLQPLWAGDLVVTMLDVGQGDGVLLETPGGATILVDAGLAKAKTAEQLQALGVEHLDLLVASHPHADHIGAMAQVISAYPPDLFWHNGMDHTTQAWGKVKAALAEQSTSSVPVHAGDQKVYDDVTLTVLWPGESLLRNTRSDLNSNSVVLRVEHGGDCLLLTGDAEAVTESQILQRDLEPCEVLKVAHHGSRHSTSARWLEALQPDYALISAGRDNRYHHPGEETMTRLLASETTVYRTDLTGLIQLTSSGEGWSVSDGLPWDAPLNPQDVVVDVAPPAASPSSPEADEPVQETAPKEPRKGWYQRRQDRLEARRAAQLAPQPDN